MFSRLRLRIRIKILCILWAVFLPPVYADELGDILAEVPGMIPGVIPGEIPWEMVLGPAFTIGNRGVLLDLTQGLKYIKKGFSLEELNRVPRAGEEEWRVLKAGESEDVIVKSIYGSSRVFLSPFSAPSQEYTILIPFNLGAERFTAPGGYFPANALYLGGIGENWAVYLNGELVQNEFYPRDRSMHRGVTVPVNSGLFLPGENILAFRVYGSSDAPDTGIYGPCYFSLLGALKDSLNDTLNLLMSGAFILIAILYFCQNFFIFKDREFNKLWTYIIFSVFCFCAALYYFTRTTMAFDLFKNTAILYAVETASFCFIGSTFWLYLDLTVHQKASPYAVGYGILCTIFSAAQI
ncbi:MAG: hypothetical protein LBN21_07055, partial [Treponema sp.]|nr:hypothetical protein [Treponema sp.]